MGTAGTVVVEQVDAGATYPLRGRVLRPGRPVEIDGDDDPGTLHLTARLLDAAGSGPGTVVGVVRFHPAPCPWRPAGHPWQLRGMATDPEVRGVGAGRALVDAGLSRLTGQAVDLVWCDAREAAVGFYERMGFVVVTGSYQVPAVGPHRGMVLELPLSAAGGPRSS